MGDRSSFKFYLGCRYLLSPHTYLSSLWKTVWRDRKFIAGPEVARACENVPVCDGSGAKTSSSGRGRWGLRREQKAQGLLWCLCLQRTTSSPLPVSLSEVPGLCSSTWKEALTLFKLLPPPKKKRLEGGWKGTIRAAITCFFVRWGKHLI